MNEADCYSGHQKCLDHVIFRENQGTNAGWDIIDEFACDEYGLGDDFGTLPWYRTVTGNTVCLLSLVIAS